MFPIAYSRAQYSNRLIIALLRLAPMALGVPCFLRRKCLSAQYNIILPNTVNKLTIGMAGA